MSKPYRILTWIILLALLAASQPASAARPGNEPGFTRSSAPSGEGNAPKAAGDEFWDNQFLLGTYKTNQPGYYGNYAIAVSGSDVYVGGDFDHAGNVAADHIAKWDSLTHRWSALGSGVNNRVLAIAANGDDVYVGGNFTVAGGVSAKYIAHWNDSTQTWSAMGSAMTMSTISPEVDAIAIAANGNVYVGGQFETVGGVSARNVARWDGSAWHALGTGVYDSAGSEITSKVQAIAINGNDVYMGGGFLYAGGTMVHNVARWNGGAWSGLGSGTGGSYQTVDAIAISGTNVYIGGRFDQVTDSTNGTQGVGHVAMWNGSEWSTMGGGVGDPDVAALVVSPGGIYVGGRFTTLADGTTPVNRIALWDGAWHAVGGNVFSNPGGGVDSNVYSLAYSSAESSIYVGGFFMTTEPYTANRIARWSIGDGEWYALGNSVNGTVYAIGVSGDDIYLGGNFTSAGGVPAIGIARWNKATQTWSGLGSGLDGCTGLSCTPVVYAIKVVGDLVYVGGNFTKAGGASASRIAVWDLTSQSWSTLGDGVFGCSGLFCSTYVRAICSSSYYGIIVGGRFDYAGSSSNLANNIAVWSQVGWSVLGDGTNGTVYVVQNPASFYVDIGGTFTSPENYFAEWNAVSWGSVSPAPVNGAVHAIDLRGRYIGGAFTDLGGPDGDYISAFYSGDWHPLAGGGLDNTVYVLALGEQAGDVFAGGDFTASGIQGLNHVAKYENDAWSGFGSGTDSTVWALVNDYPYLYVGGSFANAGDKPSAFFGRWGRLYGVFLPIAVK
jgi:hypothetical protein